MEMINATRMNLLLKKEELTAASSGAGLLRNKRDVLLAEFFSCLRPLLVLRESLDSHSREASRSLAFALGLEGKEKLRSFSFSKPKPVGFKIDYKNLLGLKIPQVALEPTEAGSSFGRIDSGSIIEETKDIFQDFLKLALKILPEELKLKRLGQEIKSTTRKVNSLEKYIIPHLRTQVKFIYQALEEREREDIFRLKRLKRRAESAIG